MPGSIPGSPTILPRTDDLGCMNPQVGHVMRLAGDLRTPWHGIFHPSSDAEGRHAKQRPASILAVPVKPE